MHRLLFGLSLIALATGLQATEKPNVLFVISDDLNYALSGMGHPECKTPHLDEFARTATSFTRAYSQFPLCGPSRASIMSGRYPITNGVTRNGGQVDPNRVTMPLHFQQHGYWSARISKIYHMGIPVDIIEGTDGGDHPPSWNQKWNVPALETMTPGKIVDYAFPEAPLVFPEERQRWKEAFANGEPYQMPQEARGQYAVVEVADEDATLKVDHMAAGQAITVLQQRAGMDAPFFLAVGFVRPHFPFVATESSLAPYDADELMYPAFPEDDFDDMPPQAVKDRKTFSEEAVREMRRGYYGAATFMDEQFGRLMAELDRLDLRKDTIVVFLSDHGYMLGEHEMYKKAKLWEEAIHVPLMISRPGQTEGSICHEFVELVDLYPTLSELAGLPEGPGCQGESLLPLLKDPTATRATKPDAFIQVSNGFGLRRDRWAFMWFPATKKDPEGFMLYDMEKDPQQFTNLANNPEYAIVMEELRNRLMERIDLAKAAP